MKRTRTRKTNQDNPEMFICECGQPLGEVTEEGHYRWPNPATCEACGLDNTLTVRVWLRKQANRDTPDLPVRGRTKRTVNPTKRNQSPTLPHKLNVLSRERRALQLRQAGATYEEIAEALGISRQGAHTIIKRVLGREQAELKADAAELIATEYRMLNELQFGIYRAALLGDFGAVEQVLKISQARRKLLGLDAPEAIKVGGFDEQLASDILGDLGVGVAHAAEDRLGMATEALGQGPKVRP